MRAKLGQVNWFWLGLILTACLGCGLGSYLVMGWVWGTLVGVVFVGFTSCLIGGLCLCARG